MRPADLPAVELLSLAALGEEFAEPQAIYANRLELSPMGCISCIADGVLHGYSIAHPWLRGQPPALNQLLGRLPPQPDCWYLHDTAMQPDMRGRGLAGSMLIWQEAQARAHGLSVIALVAVGGAASFWQRHGFIASASTALAHKLSSYGNDAVYMEKLLTT